MKSTKSARAVILTLLLAMGLTGCSNEDDMSQEDIQYLSHLDQARFFQRQGELKASTLEARSAIELQPDKVDPYFIILDNLLKAGDAVNAERQLDRLLTNIPLQSLAPPEINRAALIRAEAMLLQGEFEDAILALDSITSPDRAIQLEAALLRGRIYLASNNTAMAEEAYREAQSIDSTTALPLIGLSRLAYARNEPNQVIKFIEKAEQVDPNEAELWLWKAQLAHEQEQWKDAEDAYIRALEDIGQYDVMTYRKYETISALIQTLRAQGKSSEAFVYEEILAKSAPGTIKSNLAAASQAYQEGDMEAAGRYLEEILSQSPGHRQSSLLLGMVRFQQGRIEEAESLLSPIVEEGGSDVANKLLAATRLQLRDTEGAREALGELDSDQKDPEVLALVGIASLASGDISTGRDLIEKALSLRPDNHELRLRYASFLVQQGDTKEAVRQAQQIMESENYGDQARLLITQAYVARGEIEAAIEFTNSWVKEQPQNINALITRGQLSAREGDQNQAIRYLEEAASKAPDNPAPLIASGNLAVELSRPEEALVYFQRAVELSPNNRQALMGVSRLLKQDELVKFMREVLDKEPNAYGPKAVLLEVALNKGDSEQANQLTATLLERNSEDTPSGAAALVAAIYHGVAVRQIEEGNTEQASRILDRGRVLFPANQDIALQSAAMAFRNDNESEARNILQEVKREHPESARPFMVEATYLASQGKHREAAEMVQLALAKERTANIELAYARELQRAGQQTKAIEALEQASQAFPDNPQLLLNLAMLYQSSNQEAKAANVYEQVLTLADDNVLALNNLAWLYHQNGDERALELARRAYELNPQSGAVADTYGWILFNSGQAENSVPLLEKARELEPNAVEIAQHLVEAYKATGQDEKAKALLEKL